MSVLPGRTTQEWRALRPHEPTSKGKTCLQQALRTGLFGLKPVENQAEVQDYITRESIQKAASGIEALKENAQDMTENSIGNLLLFYMNNNAEHGNKLPEVKRHDYFFDISNPSFESRNLLHSLMAFGQYPHFDANAIAKNQAEVSANIDERIDSLIKIMKGEQA